MTNPICLRCEEPILPRDPVHGPMHFECSIRMVVGSVGHLEGKCSCFGGTDEDPPGMTIREASRAAHRLWNTQQLREQLNNKEQDE